MGNADNNNLLGDAGNDIVICGLGADVVNGGSGSDGLVGDDSSNAGGSGSLAKSDIADAALMALLIAGTPYGGLGSAGADGSVDTLWSGADADAFSTTASDVAADKNAFGYGPDL